MLFYAVNGLGLGHVTRLLAIAREVRRKRTEAQILFLTTSEADSVIFQEGFAAIKIPSRSVMREARISPHAYTKLVQTVVFNTIAAFNPAIMVADTFPAGASQELLPTLSWKMRRAFVFRAQKEDRVWDQFFQSALGHYDLCLAPHNEGDATIPVPAKLRMRWTGPIMIRTRHDAQSVADARDAAGLADGEKGALVMFGGGGDTELKEAIAVACDACRQSGWTPVVAQAPLARSRDVIPSGVRRVSYYPIAELLPAFDIAISAAGYNSVTELMHFGVPSVIIPFERSLDDQPARARAIAEAGAGLTCPLGVEPLAEELKSLQTKMCRESLSRAARALVPENGASIAAEEILGLL